MPGSAAIRVRQALLGLGVLITIGLALAWWPASVAAGPPAPDPGHALVDPSGALAMPAQSALDQILGAGHSVVTASASYGPPTQQRTRHYDAKHSAVLTQSQVTAPGYQASVQDNGVGQTLTTASSGGSLQRLTVAVVIDSAVRPAPSTAKIRQTVVAAMGLQPTRGDRVTVAVLPMAAPAAPATTTGASGVSRVTPYLRSGFCSAAAILMVAALTTDAMRRRSRALP